MPLSINTYETAMSNNLTKRDIVIKIFTEKGYPQKHIRDSVQMTLDAISEALPFAKIGRRWCVWCVGLGQRAAHEA